MPIKRLTPTAAGLAISLCAGLAAPCFAQAVGPSMIDEYVPGNRQLAAHIAELPDAERVMDERQHAPEITRLLRELQPMITRGSSGSQIQQHVLSQYRQRGWRPMLVGYQGYPYAVPVSINDGFLSGFPTPQPIPSQALVKVELIAGTPSSYLAQTWTFASAGANARQLAMIDAARVALRSGIEQIHDGASADAVGNAIGDVLQAHRLYPIREYCGYRMGAQRIEAPQLLSARNNYPRKDRLQAGQVLNVYVLAQTGPQNTRVNVENMLEALTQNGGDAVVLSAMVEVTQGGYRLLSEFVD